MFYPVEALPEWLRPLAHALPITPALEALRAALFQGASLGALRDQLMALAAFAFLLGPLAAWLFARTLRRARIDGSLGLY